MTCIVKLWTQQELESLCTDKWLATVFMNRKTFNKEEMKYYPYNQRHQYNAIWYNESTNEPEEVTFYATDDEMAIRFLNTEYSRLPDELGEVMTNYRPITNMS